MSTLSLELRESRSLWPAWRENAFALVVAVALHAGLAFVLLNLSHNAPLAPAVSAVITTQLITLSAPVLKPPAPIVPEPPTPAPIPEPVVEAPMVEQADLAFKRVEQEPKERERVHELNRERQQRREEALRQERLAQEEQERQALLKEQQLAQAEAQRQNAAQAAAAAARAEAEAASRQYLPIAKQAPDYPQRALERKIEGECTVAYTVNATGRVEDPQVVGVCHPMFVKPSLAAAKTFRYQPRVVNGQAVAVANVKNTFSYRIQ